MHVDQVAMEVMNVEEDEMGNKVKDLSLFFPRYSFFGLNFFIPDLWTQGAILR